MSRGLKCEPAKDEGDKRKKLDLFLEIGGDVDLEWIGK
jgi:hypothetical protein